MSNIKICPNCGKEFVRKNCRQRHKRRGKICNYKYCSNKCYWEYHLKDVLKKGE